MIEFGISRYKSFYSNRYQDTNFVLYQKYTYEDVCRLLDWENNEVPLNIGGYKFDKKTNTFPVFINYDKDEDIQDTIKYEDHFISNSRLIAISKQGHSTGVPTIQDELEKIGSPRAEFFTDEDRRAMRIRIPIQPAFLKEKENVIENVIEISEDELKHYMPEVSKKKLEKVVKIIKMISKNPYVSIDEMKAEMHVTDRTVARYLSDLKDNKIIERKGPDNGGIWKILI